MTLGKTLAELRKNAKMTQSELGEKLNISAQAISKWENGTSEPDLATIKKIAAIYGVPVSSIIEEDVDKIDIGKIDTGRIEEENANQDDESAKKSPFDSLYDVYITKVNNVNKIAAIKRITDMLGGYGFLAEAKNAVDGNLPYCISGKIDEETAERIIKYFAEASIEVSLEPCTGLHDKRPIYFEKPEPPRDEPLMKRRFIIANITAIVPAIAVLIFCLSLGITGFFDVFLSAYTGFSLYSLIFLLWYPTLVRTLLFPFAALASTKGCLATIGSIFLFIILIPWMIIVGLISPIIYAFSIKKRIVRMREGDLEDDIFGSVYNFPSLYGTELWPKQK